MNGRRGFIGDIVTVIISLFVFSLVILIAALTVYYVKEAFIGADIPSEAKDIITSGESVYPESMDVLIAFFAIGVPLIAAAFAFFLDVSAVFFWLIIGASVFYILLGAVFGQMWEWITTTGIFGVVLARMPITDWVMTHYAIYALFVTFIILAGLFFRFRRQI